MDSGMVALGEAEKQMVCLPSEKESICTFSLSNYFISYSFRYHDIVPIFIFDSSSPAREGVYESDNYYSRSIVFDGSTLGE